MAFFSISFLVLLLIRQLPAADLTTAPSTAHTTAAPNEGCLLDVEPLWKEKNANIPLLVDTATNSIINPVMNAANKRVINLVQNQKVKVVCAGVGNKFKLTNPILLHKASVDATCGGATPAASTIVVNNAPFTYSQLRCAKQNKEKIKETGKTCLNTSPAIGSLIQIGWQLDSSFISIYEVCFDKQSLGNLYSKHVIDGKSVGANFSPGKEGNWEALTYYGTTDVDVKYKSQKTTMIDILGDLKTFKKYFDLNDNSGPQDFLSRGHFTPRGDFVDLASQQSTYYFINAAPQFQSFNGGSWSQLEEAVIKKAAKAKNLKLMIYTGTYEILQLNDKDDKLQNIYLHFDKKANAKLPKAIPVPRYYWKVVYDPVSKTGTAFIGVNYPKKAAVNLDEKVTVFCNDVWKEIVFVQYIQRQNTKAGYLFACTVDELFKKIGTPEGFPAVISGLFNPV